MSKFAIRVRWAATCMAVANLPSFLFAQDQRPGIKRLDDPTRARVLAALAALVILGFAMVLLTWLAARITQRYRRGTAYFRPTVRPGEHAWAKKPLSPADPDFRPPTSDA
jgi:hypothetical protein